jgi:hypothetical protein
MANKEKRFVVSETTSCTTVPRCIFDKGISVNSGNEWKLMFAMEQTVVSLIIRAVACQESTIRKWEISTERIPICGYQIHV